MNGLEFVTRKTEKTRNSNDLGGREGKRLKQIEGTFLPQQKLVKKGHFCQGKLAKRGIFPPGKHVEFTLKNWKLWSTLRWGCVSMSGNAWGFIGFLKFSLASLLVNFGQHWSTLRWIRVSMSRNSWVYSIGFLEFSWESMVNFGQDNFPGKLWSTLRWRRVSSEVSCSGQLTFLTLPSPPPSHQATHSGCPFCFIHLCAFLLDGNLVK